MAIQVKDAGSWKPVVNLHVKDAGTWKSVSAAYVKDAGVWKLAFQARRFKLTIENLGDAVGFSDGSSPFTRAFGSLSPAKWNGKTIKSLASAVFDPEGGNWTMVLKLSASDTTWTSFTVNGNTYVRTSATETSPGQYEFFTLSNRLPTSGTIDVTFA